MRCSVLCSSSSFSSVPRLSASQDIDITELEVCRREDGTLWELGRGSFGTVFKALRRGVQEVALKKVDKISALHLQCCQTCSIKAAPTTPLCRLATHPVFDHTMKDYSWNDHRRSGRVYNIVSCVCSQIDRGGLDPSWLRMLHKEIAILSKVRQQAAQSC